jgi:hypothetical protein
VSGLGLRLRPTDTRVDKLCWCCCCSSHLQCRREPQSAPLHINLLRVCIKDQLTSHHILCSKRAPALQALTHLACETSALRASSSSSSLQ